VLTEPKVVTFLETDEGVYFSQYRWALGRAGGLCSGRHDELSADWKL